MQTSGGYEMRKTSSSAFFLAGVTYLSPQSIFSLENMIGLKIFVHPTNMELSPQATQVTNTKQVCFEKWQRNIKDK